ncbi:hypothetical protein Dimus_028883 [Dionaea muscipula]
MLVPLVSSSAMAATKCKRIIARLLSILSDIVASLLLIFSTGIMARLLLILSGILARLLLILSDSGQLNGNTSLKLVLTYKGRGGGVETVVIECSRPAEVKRSCPPQLQCIALGNQLCLGVEGQRRPTGAALIWSHC